MKLSNRTKGHLFLLPLYGVIGILAWVDWLWTAFWVIVIGLSILFGVFIAKGIKYLTKAKWQRNKQA